MAPYDSSKNFERKFQFDIENFCSIETLFRLLPLFADDLTSIGKSDLKTRWDDIVGKSTDEAAKKVSSILSKGEEKVSKLDCQRIKEVIHQMELTMAEKALKESPIASAFIILQQISFLIQIWTRVKGAKNLASDSTEKLQIIKTRIEHLQNDAIELREFMTQFESGRVLMNQELLGDIEKKTTSMTPKLVETREMLSNLKFRIDGEIKKLDDLKKNQMDNQIRNKMGLASNALQCTRMNSTLGSGLQLLQFCVTAFYVGLVVADEYMNTVTEETLEKLRKHLNEIYKMENQLESIARTVEKAKRLIAEQKNSGLTKHCPDQLLFISLLFLSFVGCYISDMKLGYVVLLVIFLIFVTK